MNKRRRNKRSSAVREALWADWDRGSFADGEGRARQMGTGLVIETGDLLLEFLVVTATESIERPKQDLSVDEERLTQALEDVEAVKACWVFLTYAMAVRSAGYAFTADAGLEQSMYEDVGALVETLWPRPPEEEATIDAGLDAENLGYWSLEWVYTRHAFWLLIGEAVDQLALFRELEPAIDLRLLEIAWDGGGHVLDHVIETATYDFRGGLAY